MCGNTSGGAASIEITVDYNMTEEEFSELGDYYPTGDYETGGETKWFRLYINKNLSLVWFQRWE
jgi:hypothetical protein